MPNKMLINPDPIRLWQGVALIRITIGLLLAYHGQEVFDSTLMNEYAGWETFRGPNASLLVYTGKGAELVAGILLTLGLFTRPAALLAIITLSYITFFIGNGRFWYQDQHPFLFVLFGLLFLFTGPGSWSLDRYLYSRNSPRPN
jgi:putative oxidoreductase